MDLLDDRQPLEAPGVSPDTVASRASSLPASDTTRSEQLREAVEAAQQTRKDFIAAISHELRTPLTALTGYGELLADGILGPLLPAQLETVERMRAAVSQLSMMVDSVLSYSSLEGGRERVLIETVSLERIVQDVALSMDALARKKGVTFTTDLQNAQGTVQSDGDKIRQILIYLCDNAVKFTDTGGSVSLHIEQDEHMVRFMVRDSGIGIAPHDQRALFEPFLQLDTGLTRRYGGAGLGLHVSQRLAELINGRVTVESNLGEGSVFMLAVPR